VVLFLIHINTDGPTSRQTDRSLRDSPPGPSKTFIIVPQVSTLAPWIGRQTVVHAAPSTRLQGLQGVQGPLQLYTRRAVCALHASRIDL
jgi:hypothetical protein